MEYAECGYKRIDGQVQVFGDALKHLGPPIHLEIPEWGRLFSTRCQIQSTGNNMRYTNDNDDFWCPECLSQAGIGYELKTF